MIPEYDIVLQKEPRDPKAYLKIFVRVFHLAFISGCVGLILFCAYVLYRQANAEPGFFAVSILERLNKTMVITGQLSGVAGCVLAGWNFLAIDRKKYWRIITILLLLVCITALIGGYMVISRTEGRYLHHSMYFKWYLYAAVPVAICSIVGLVGLLGLWKRQIVAL